MRKTGARASRPSISSDPSIVTTSNQSAPAPPRADSDGADSDGAGGTPALRGGSRGWHTRGYHPHCDYPGLIQSIGFRLFDSVPDMVVRRWNEELSILGDPRRQRILRERIERYADMGYGSCLLAEPRVARLVQDSLLHFDRQRYDLLAWCVMSNHVHVLVATRSGYSLSEIVHSWKSYTSHQANKLLGRTGRFWFVDYFDRFMRSTEQMEAGILYIENNPITARLVSRPEEWPFSSATPTSRDRVICNRSRVSCIDPQMVPEF